MKESTDIDFLCIGGKRKTVQVEKLSPAATFSGSAIPFQLYLGSYDAVRYQWEKLCHLAECINEGDKLYNTGVLISQVCSIIRPIPIFAFTSNQSGLYQNLDIAAAIPA